MPERVTCRDASSEIIFFQVTRFKILRTRGEMVQHSIQKTQQGKVLVSSIIVHALKRILDGNGKCPLWGQDEKI